MKTFRLVTFVAFLLATVLMSGCVTQAGSFVPQTRFDYPNSNVTAMGAVSATKLKTSVVIPSAVNENDLREVESQALAQKPGADILLNMRVNTKVTTIPIPIFSIFKTRLTIEGTAASMEVGQQELK